MIVKLASLVVLIAACSGGESSSPKPAPEKAQETVAADDSEPVEEEQNDTMEEEIALISEARARDILAASCLAAGCHAEQEDSLINNASLTRERVADGSMPPDYQARYTLSDTRRKQLIKFFDSRLAE